MAGRGRENADDALVLHLAAGLTIKAAARKAKVSERTAYRRLEDPDFRRRVTEARSDMVQRAIGKLCDSATAAVDTLRGLLKAKADTVKLSAARSILELGHRLRQSVELELRLVALEEQFAERGNR